MPPAAEALNRIGPREAADLGRVEGNDRRWWRYPLAVEWALEWFVYRLRGLALFDLLELAGRTTVLVVAVLS